MKKLLFCTSVLMSLPITAAAQSNDWKIGAVLDLAHTSKELGLGQRQQGFALGHSDVMANGTLGEYVGAQIGAAVHSHDKKYEMELEEAWLQTRTLPFGLQARMGRFPSQIGYLNEQHPHADDFVERPLLYRSFLGGHWFDDGVRLNWTAPTDFYLNVGVEAFRGNQLIQESQPAPQLGIATFNAKLGADINTSHSWQVGFSYLLNRRNALLEDEHEDEHGHEGEDHHDHNHAHGAQYYGKKLWLTDFTWKWAPDGNNQREQVKFNAEFARVTEINPFASKSDIHQASAISVVWRFLPSWEVGARTDFLKVSTPHGDHFHKGQLRENSVMLTWKQTHRQVVRLQIAQQRDAKGMEHVTKQSIQLQTIFSFGAHGAHSY
jgi:hypothetical protein